MMDVNSDLSFSYPGRTPINDLFLRTEIPHNMVIQVLRVNVPSNRVSHEVILPFVF